MNEKLPPPYDIMHEKIVRISLIEGAVQHLQDKINDHVPEGLERTLAIQKLKEACFWAREAIAVEASDG